MTAWQLPPPRGTCKNMPGRGEGGGRGGRECGCHENRQNTKYTAAQPDGIVIKYPIDSTSQCSFSVREGQTLPNCRGGYRKSSYKKNSPRTTIPAPDQTPSTIHCSRMVHRRFQEGARDQSSPLLKRSWRPSPLKCRFPPYPLRMRVAATPREDLAHT